MSRPRVTHLAVALLLTSFLSCSPRSSHDTQVGGIRSLPSPAGPGSGQPNLAVDPAGRVYLSWLEARGSHGHALFWSTLDGDRWSDPRQVAAGDSFVANWADFPTLLALGDGRMAAQWLWSNGPDGYDVRVALSSNGGASWSAPIVPHRDGTRTEHGFASLVPEGDGVRVVWLDGRNFAKQGHEPEGAADAGPGPDMMLRTEVIGFESGAGGDSLLDPRVCDCCQTAVIATAGGALAAYRDRDPDELRDVSLARLDTGRPPTTYAGPRDGWKLAGCPVNGPALDASGVRVVLAWFTAAGDSGRVKAAFSSDGGRTFDSPVRVDEGAPLGRVDAVLLEDGSALVTWLEGRGDSAAILARRVAPGRRPREPLEVAKTSSDRASGVPRAVRTGQRVIFAWTEAADPPRVKTAEARVTP